MKFYSKPFSLSSDLNSGLLLTAMVEANKTFLGFRIEPGVFKILFRGAASDGGESPFSWT